ncbi:MAG: hypothetical protein Q8930_10650 [Bacillota bacterium]|nr:hypothetical protein [Bacillota bacterium]
MANGNNKQLETPNLKVLSDQIGYESLMNKKFSEYASQCGDTQLKNLFNESAQVHKQNFTNLKNYLDSHQ